MTDEQQETLDQKIGRYRDLKDALDDGYRQLKELEFAILTDIEERHPGPWADWERGLRSINIGPVSVPVSRKYDVEKFKEIVGAEYPEIVEDALTIREVPARRTETVNGAKLRKHWNDLSVSRLLEQVIKPPERKLELS